MKDKSIKQLRVKFNPHFQTYFHLEKEFESLLYAVQLDDCQLNVYSQKIADLILWNSAEIESLSKALYKLVLAPTANTDGMKFDYDCFDKVVSEYEMESLHILFSTSTVNLSDNNRIILPCLKADRKKDGTLTYSWNNAYQNLKHDKVNSIGKFGTFFYLINSFAVLYLLNIYFYFENSEYPEDSQVGVATNKEIMKNNLFEASTFYEKGYKEDVYSRRHGYFNSFEESVFCRIFYDHEIDRQKEIVEKFIRREIWFSKIVLDKHGNESMEYSDDFNRLIRGKNAKYSILNRGKKHSEKNRRNPIDFSK